MDNPLEFVTSEDLIAELKRRNQAMLVVTLDHKEFINADWGGYKVCCIGLADYARQRLYDMLTETETADGK